MQNDNLTEQQLRKPLLFSWYHSSCAWRVRIALEYKGIDYDIYPVDLLRHEQFDAKFLKLNPMGQVPALVINGLTLVQSIAIMEYLEEVYPDKPILPKHPLERERVREICELIASGIQPIQNLKVQGKHSENEIERLKWAQFWIRNGFAVLERELVKHSNDFQFCVGQNVTMADFCLVPQVANAYRFKVKMDSFPTILKIYTNLSTIDAFRRAHAFTQKDCPAELRMPTTMRSKL